MGVIPKAPSVGEAALARDLQCYKILTVPEYQFDRKRKWRFDFAIPPKNIGIEVEGGTWSKGRHSRGAGFAADCLKYNAAVLQGWRILRFTTEQVLSGYAIDTILEAVA